MMNGSFSAAAAGRMKPGSFTGGLDGASFTGAMGPPRMANSFTSFGARGRAATAAPESCPSVPFSIPSDIPEGREAAPDAMAIDMAQLKEGACEKWVRRQGWQQGTVTRRRASGWRSLPSSLGATIASAGRIGWFLGASRYKRVATRHSNRYEM